MRRRRIVFVQTFGTVFWGASALTPGGEWWSQMAQVLLAMLFAFALGASLCGPAKETP